MPPSDTFPLFNHQAAAKSGDKILNHLQPLRTTISNLTNTNNGWHLYSTLTRAVEDPVLGHLLMSSHLSPTKPKRQVL